MSVANRIGHMFAEAVWPTRCVVCDAPGAVLCSTCAENLPFIDQCKACPTCGAPYGMHVCTECNTFTLREAGLKTTPFAQCVSAVTFTDSVARILRGRKDAGERRLDEVVGFYIASVIPPEWVSEAYAVTSIPATRKALRGRGFDHGKSLAQATAQWLGLPYTQLLQVTSPRDQRALGRFDRFANMSAAFMPLPTVAPSSVILVDDVYTTGATLMAASTVLAQQGVRNIYCATFAHVYRN